MSCFTVTCTISCHFFTVQDCFMQLSHSTKPLQTMAVTPPEHRRSVIYLLAGDIWINSMVKVHDPSCIRSAYMYKINIFQFWSSEMHLCVIVFRKLDLIYDLK